MNRTLALVLVFLQGLWDASAMTFLYDKPFESNPSPQEEPPWMTLDVDGSVFTFEITTSAILKSVYFKVQDPDQVSITDTEFAVAARVVNDPDLD